MDLSPLFHIGAILFGILCCCHSQKENIGQYLYINDDDRRAIFRMPTAGGTAEIINATSGISKPHAIAYDPVHHDIYWTDASRTQLQGIRRYRLNDSSVSFMPLSDTVSRGIAVDPGTNKVYITNDGSKKQISCIDFERKTSTTVISGSLGEPYGIVIDPLTKWMYWSDTVNSRIEKAKLDGTGRQSLVPTGVRWPKGMAFDQKDSRLYFCDGHADSGSVQSIGENGNDRRTHFRDNLKSYEFLGLAIDDKYIYLSSWKPSLILRISKDTIGASGHLESLGETSSLTDLRGIALVGLRARNNDEPPIYMKIDFTHETDVELASKPTMQFQGFENDDTQKIYKYVSLIVVPIMLVVLVVIGTYVCFKRSKCSNRRKSKTTECEDYYEDIEALQRQNVQQ